MNLDSRPREASAMRLRTVLVAALVCFCCEQFADYRYEVINRTAHPLRVDIRFSTGPDTGRVDTVGPFAMKEVLTLGTGTALGCNEVSPQLGGFSSIRSFIIATVDTPSSSKDFLGSSLWNYRIDGHTGVYSIAIDSASFLP